MAIYTALGVRRVGIVDFDILRKAEEWRAVLETLCFSDEHVGKVTPIRDSIAQHAKQEPAEARLEQTSELVGQVNQLLEQFSNADFEAGQEGERRQAIDDLLGQLERRLQEAAHVTKPWNELKREGRANLSDELELKFRLLFDVSASHGLFIIPTGELESILSDYGIPHTTNKRQWIRQALTLISELEVNTSHILWDFVEKIDAYACHRENKTK